MFECSACRGQVPDGASRCMHCGVVFTNSEWYQNEMKAQGQGYAIGIVIFVVAFFFFWLTTE